MVEPKPIPAEYRGVKYRSRLEARWAVFFDAVGEEYHYHYEYEGFQLPSGWYLPDFFLPRIGLWVEIKPDEPTDEETRKAVELSRASFWPVVIFGGVIGSHRAWMYWDGEQVAYESYWPASWWAYQSAQKDSFWPVREFPYRPRLRRYCDARYSVVCPGCDHVYWFQDRGTGEYDDWHHLTELDRI